VIDDEDVVGLLLDDAGDPLPVLRAEDQRPEDEEVEGALQVGAVFAVRSLSDRHSTQVCRTWVECQHVRAGHVQAGGDAERRQSAFARSDFPDAGIRQHSSAPASLFPADGAAALPGLSHRSADEDQHVDAQTTWR